MTIRQRLAAAAAVLTIGTPFGALAGSNTDQANILLGFDGQPVVMEPHYEEEETITTTTVRTSSGSSAQKKLYVDVPKGKKGPCGQKYDRLPVGGLDTTEPTTTSTETSVLTRKFNRGGEVVTSIENEESGFIRSGVTTVINPTPMRQIHKAQAIQVVKTPSALKDATDAIGDVVSFKLGVNFNNDRIHGYEGDKTSTNISNDSASQSSAKTAPVTATGGSSSAKTAPVTATGGSSSAKTGAITNTADANAKTGPVVATGGTANNEGVKAISNNEGVKAISGSQANNGGVKIDNADTTNNSLTAVNKTDVELVAVQKTDIEQKATNIGGDTNVGVKTGDTKVVVPVAVDTKIVTPTRPENNGGNGGCDNGYNCD